MDRVNPILVEFTRGELVESRHRGAIAIADASGRLAWSCGDVERPIYPRSAVKMLQALTLVESGAADAYGLSDEELALACASHSGEPFHVAAVRGWLARIALDETALACGAPAGPDGRPLTRAHHNCSGKHTGFLTDARRLGVETRGYERPDHPVQRRVLATMAEMAGVDVDDMPVAVDGCTAPAVVLPLRALATAVARIADPSGLPPDRAAAARRLDAAVKARPLYVAGTGRACTALIQAAGGEASVKTGAEGVFVAAVSSLGLGVALKIDDGAVRASETAIAAVLAALGAVQEEDAAIKALSNGPVVNSVGEIVGARRPTAWFRHQVRLKVANERPRLQ
ncbi:MAG TPA: asparaginase [Caulobacteraceae bacterium]|nr:asparaginase [Caulobacteraceae bacterium]